MTSIDYFYFESIKLALQNIPAQLYKSSSSLPFLACTLLVGHLICGPCWFDVLLLVFAKLGSNFLLNCSNFSKSMLVTDFLAVLNAYSKCFLVIYGTGSKFWAFPPFWINCCILTYASMDLNQIKNYISYCRFCSLLTDFSQVSAWETISNVCQKVKINIFGKRSLS